MPYTLAELRACFPVAESWVYFNHAAVCPVARPVAEAVTRFLADATAHGSTGFAAWDGVKASVRSKAARLVGCRETEVALTTSTSQGLIAVAEGLPMAAGDEIILVENDFPANRIPWFRQRRRGAVIVDVPRDAAGRVTAQAILDRVTPRTRVLALPFVLYDNGYRLDLQAIGAGLGSHPAWLCVDAIQGLGALPLEMAAWRIDALSADSHKWLLGLEGMGLFCCRTERLPELDSPLMSWMSQERPFQPWREGAARRRDARQHEFACLPTALCFGLEASLDLLLGTGIPTLAGQISALTERLAAGLSTRGWVVVSPRERHGETSGIVSARPPRGSVDEAVAALEAAHVSVAARAGAVRFSPHAWNSPAEVDAALAALP